MSREVIESGLADSILPLEDIPYEIMRSLNT
jgi:chemotaxis response regulator CheB